jgi:hypothetical protein
MLRLVVIGGGAQEAHGVNTAILSSRYSWCSPRKIDFFLTDEIRARGDAASHEVEARTPAAMGCPFSIKQVSQDSIVQDNCQKGPIDSDFFVVIDEAEFSELVHELIYA